MGGLYCPCRSGRRSVDCCFNPLGGPPKPLKRYQMWSQEYMKRRYLEHLSVEDLVARANDIMTNMTTLTEDLKIGLHPIHEAGEAWMKLWGDVLTECGLRNGFVA